MFRFILQGQHNTKEASKMKIDDGEIGNIIQMVAYNRSTKRLLYLGKD